MSDCERCHFLMRECLDCKLLRLESENASLCAQLETQATVSKTIITRLEGELEQQQQMTAKARAAAKTLLGIWRRDNCRGLDELLKANPWLKD